MDTVRILFLAGLLGITLSATVWAGMTWEDCVKTAEEKNPDIAYAVQGMKSYEALYRATYANFMPQLSASASYTASSAGVASTASAGSSTLVTGPESQGNSVQNSYSAGINATLNVFNGFADLGKIRQGKANLEAAKATLNLAKATVSSNLKTAYAELLFEQKAIDLNRIILKREEANLRLITLHFEGGQENKGNQMYQQATVAQARYQYEHAGRNLRIAIRQLAALIGEPDREELTVSGDFITHDPPNSPDLRALATANPSHNYAYYEQISANAAVQIANGNWMPNVSLNGFVGRLGGSFPPEDSRWSAGVTVTYPFFPGTSTLFGTQSAYALEAQAEYNTTSTDNKLIATLAQAYDNFRDAVAQLRVAEEFEKAAKARETIATEKYNTGLMTFEDWTVIDTDLSNREQNLLTDQRNAMQAEATWEIAMGKGAIP